MKEKNVSRA